MIRHIVLVRFAPTVSSSECASILAELAGLKAAIPTILAITVGSGAAGEAGAKGYTHAATFDFPSTVERDAYLAHPNHVAVAKRLAAATDGGREGMIVFNLDTTQGSP